MRHRHLDYDHGTPVASLGLAALDDLLERGDLDDWTALARAVAKDPGGELATSVLHLVEHHPMYGTSALWRTWIERLRKGGGEAAMPRPAATDLASVRRGRELTQTELAARLGVAQPDVSKLERRSDARLSTLRAYVAATGGRLRCEAVYEDGTVVELSLGRDQSSQVVGRRGSGE